MPKVHLIDGGLSTELANLGADLEGNLWTGLALLNNPDVVQAAHRQNVHAGAEVVISSSYQLSRAGFEEIGLDASSADAALMKSVLVAREAVSGSAALVAASVGPYGAVLHDGSEFLGDYSVSQGFLEDFHAERIQVLLESKPDMLAIETIPSVAEARALSRVLEKVEIPMWFSFTAGSESKLWTGEAVEAAVEAIAGLNNLVAIGVNCVAPELVAGLLSRISSVSETPMIAYPNRGGKWDAINKKWLDETPQALVSWLPQWLDSGAKWVGGCCGTDSTDIAALRLALSK